MTSSGRLLTAAGLAVSALLLSSFTATASDNSTDAGSEAHYAGSQIAIHEGGLATPRDEATLLPGLDVSAYQGNVDWNSVVNNGATFAYVKATEGTSWTSGYFAQQYNGSYNAGLIRGAYHFARPNYSSGAAQADFFVSHGGGWSGDGQTLPPMLDIEYAPSGNICYGMSQSDMVNWIWDFNNEVANLTGRWVTIYTSLNWWQTCTGNDGSFGDTNPLFIARYAGSPGTLPAGFGFWTFWQYSDRGTFPGDQDYFNGPIDRLQALANG